MIKLLRKNVFLTSIFILLSLTVHKCTKFGDIFRRRSKISLLILLLGKHNLFKSGLFSQQRDFWIPSDEIFEIWIRRTWRFFKFLKEEIPICFLENNYIHFQYFGHLRCPFIQGVQLPGTHWCVPWSSKCFTF